MDGPVYKLITFLGPLGHLGVDVFFVISGFLITGILIKDYEENINIKRFYIRRFFKIIPQYAVLILFVFCLALNYGLHFGITDYLPYFLFIQNYTTHLNILSHCWSLAVEEQYYLFYPLIIQGTFFLVKNPQIRRWGLFFICLFLIGFTVVYRHGANQADWYKNHSYELTLYRLDGLLCGSILKLLEPYYTNFNSPKRIFFTGIYFFIGIFIFYYFSTVIDINLNIACWDKYVLTNIATVLLFLSAYQRFGLFNLFLENSFVRWIGRISYALYLWHYPFLYIFVPTKMFQYNRTTCLMLYLLATVFISVLSTYTIEKFFLNLRKKIMP